MSERLRQRVKDRIEGRMAPFLAGAINTRIDDIMIEFGMTGDNARYIFKEYILSNRFNELLLNDIHEIAKKYPGFKRQEGNWLSNPKHSRDTVLVSTTCDYCFRQCNNGIPQVAVPRHPLRSRDSQSRLHGTRFSIGESRKDNQTSVPIDFVFLARTFEESLMMSAQLRATEYTIEELRPMFLEVRYPIRIVRVSDNQIPDPGRLDRGRPKSTAEGTSGNERYNLQP